MAHIQSTPDTHLLPHVLAKKVQAYGSVQTYLWSHLIFEFAAH
jgi:hypothetical protein